MIGNIEYGKVSEIASSLRNVANNMQSILDNSRQQMQKVNTEETFRSNAGELLYNKFQNLSKRFESFYEAVNSYAKFLDNTVATYQAEDAREQQQADQLAS